MAFIQDVDQLYYVNREVTQAVRKIDYVWYFPSSLKSAPFAFRSQENLLHTRTKTQLINDITTL